MHDYKSTPEFLSYEDNNKFLSLITENHRLAHSRFFRAFFYMLLAMALFLALQFNIVDGIDVQGITFSDLSPIKWLAAVFFQFQYYTLLYSFIQYDRLDAAIKDLIDHATTSPKAGSVPGGGSPNPADLLIINKTKQELKQLINPPSILSFETDGHAKGLFKHIATAFSFTMLLAVSILPLLGTIHLLVKGLSDINNPTTPNILPIIALVAIFLLLLRSLHPILIIWKKLLRIDNGTEFSQ